VPHNITILDAAGGTAFVGETFSGPGSKLYTLPPMPAGRYAFRCDVHTYMTGTLIVGPTPS
jgi:plastocyanin